MKNDTYQWLIDLPKAELHVHLEGTLEPEQLLLFARRNNVPLAHTNTQDVKQLYTFHDYASFIQAYQRITQVLCTEQDFYELTLAYLRKAKEQGIVHAEIFFDIQTYLPRGIQPATIMYGIHKAFQDAYQQWGITGGMIMCFLRHLGATAAMEALHVIAPYKHIVLGVGLASLENHDDLTNWVPVFTAARAQGYHVVAHAGETSLAALQQTLALLPVERIDHGIQAVHDPAILELLAQKKIPVTVCPLSNKALGLLPENSKHPVRIMLDAGIIVTIGSDDPVFFGGYVVENYHILGAQGLITAEDTITLVGNSIRATFADATRKKELLTLLQERIR